ncbi:Cytochrome c-type biogenesis protein CcmF [Rickettsia tillamookensis]|uniref:Cytochrome c-type biogenesis protein CcmF n=2 Tax=Rickettsia tillamookensis TaxID=2761623 RepID=A0A9E6MIK2_9RICK|nr:Cytochrome c-type biogenesis protein CcmF [Rickettsia tillamookensis]
MCLSGMSILLSFPRRREASITYKKLTSLTIVKLFFLDSRFRGNDIYFYTAALCSILAFFALVYAFIISDFSLQNVFLNSSTLKPLIYKIAGSWSSHEGSMLLWFCLLQIVSCCYIFLLEDNRLKFLSIIILSAIQLFFSSFIYFTSNPFNVFSFVPKEGLGLNPMLQDIALSIHPPLLYLGYVSYVVPFTIVCTKLVSSRGLSTGSSIKRDKSSFLYFLLLDPVDKPRDDTLHLLKTFSNIGILFTTIGISLGSWWAYRELGWGGFWFFDPVENISLFPWLSGIMLHHSIIVTTKTNRIVPLHNWTIILSIVTFLLVIFSTFLVRSGFITSIHSFAFSPERGIYLLGIFLILSIGSIGLYTTTSLRGGALASTKQSQETSRDCCSHFRGFAMTNCGNGIFLGNISFLLSLIVLIAATLYPPIYSLFDDKPIIINETFFINNFIIFVIPILCTIGLFTTRSSIKKHIIILILSLIITYLISLKLTFSVISILTIIASIFLMLHNVHYLLIKTNYFRNRLKASAASMILGHFGFALIAFSITLNSLLQSEMDFTGRVGTSKTFNEFKVTLQNIKFAQGKNYYRQIAEFWLEDNSRNITILKPENRLYIVEKSLSQESDIYSYLLYDLYAVLSNIDGDIIHAKIYYKPMMSFIWLGIILTAFGFFIALIRKNSS